MESAAIPSEMYSGGSSGSETTRPFILPVLSSSFILMPSPASTIAYAAQVDISLHN